MGGPPDRVGKAFDEVWGELVGKTDAVEPGRGVSKDGADTAAWDDQARARTLSDGPKVEVEDSGEPQQPGPGKTLAAGAGYLAQDARELREANTRGEMEWLMTVSPEASGFGKIIDPDDDGAAVDPQAPTRPGLAPEGHGSATDAEAPDVSDPGESNASLVQESAPEDATPPVVTADISTTGAAANGGPGAAKPRSSRGAVMLVAAGLTVAAGVALMLRAGPDPKIEADVGIAAAAANLDATSDAASRAVRDRVVHSDGASPRGPDSNREPDDSSSSDGSDGSADSARSGSDGGDAIARTALAVVADPREPPPGTPPETAVVFRKLPVSPADRAPVGAVGASGIHIDQISMGATYDRGKCGGEARRFSLAVGDRPSVCVRVVHQRTKEELVVQWEKQGGAKRRGKLHVKSTHAYRTRTYLMLRQEYIGEWTVKILSQDGAELAAYSFSVVE